VVAGKREASSAALAQGRLRSLNGGPPLRGTPHLPRRLPCRSPSLRRRGVGIDSGKDAPFPRIVHCCPMGARWPGLRVSPLPRGRDPGAETAVSPCRCRPGTRYRARKTPFSPDRYPSPAVSGPVGRQGRSGINSEASSGFMPHRTLRLPGRDRPQVPSPTPLPQG